MRWCLFRGFFFLVGGVGPSDIIFWGWRKRRVGSILVVEVAALCWRGDTEGFKGYWDGIIAVRLLWLGA